MSQSTNGAGELYQATIEVKNAINTYNKYCNDFNNAQGYSDAGKATIAGLRLIQAAEKLAKLNVPLTGDPAEVVDMAEGVLDQYRDTAGAQSIPINDFRSDPYLQDFWEQIPKEPVDNFNCPTIDYQIPLAPASTGFFGDIVEAVNDFWESAQAAMRARRDPLIFDLDGDDLETSGIADTNPVLFDHDGDGVKNGTGWVDADDAFLVLDKNGNGTIDNGLELFGDSTIKSDGTTAADGFDALADLDSDADGVISNADAQFTNLRLWRDLNQGGNKFKAEIEIALGRKVELALRGRPRKQPNKTPIMEKQNEQFI